MNWLIRYQEHFLMKKPEVNNLTETVSLSIEKLIIFCFWFTANDNLRRKFLRTKTKNQIFCEKNTFFATKQHFAKTKSRIFVYYLLQLILMIFVIFIMSCSINIGCVSFKEWVLGLGGDGMTGQYLVWVDLHGGGEDDCHPYLSQVIHKPSPGGEWEESIRKSKCTSIEKSCKKRTL